MTCPASAMKSKDVKSRIFDSHTPSASSETSKTPKRIREESEEEIEDSPGVRRFQGHTAEVILFS
jgi:hypothetical protein